MKKVCIIGSGNIGSRHLQALKKVNFPLSIEVVDPSPSSLKTAKERYNQILSKISHKIIFLKNQKDVSKKIDLAIIATSSNIRSKVIGNLFSTSIVKYLILEKILFQKKADYPRIEKLLKNKGAKSWVNFSMRTMPFYRNLKGKLKGPLQMIVSGGQSQYGLISNILHFVDYMMYLTSGTDFTIGVNGLDKRIIDSKREGFLELTGTMNVYFKDGSVGTFVCFANGNSPFTVEIFSANLRCLSKETERKAWISSSHDNWKWEEIDSNIPYQSDMTNLVVEEIFKTGGSILTPYSDACKIHLQFLEDLLKFLNSISHKKFNFYPFT